MLSFGSLRRFILVLGVALFVTPCFSMVYFSKDEALEMAFGTDASVELLSLFPTESQMAQIEQLAKSKLESNLISVFVGKKQGQIVGYAMIESHNVRTQPETMLLVVDADGNLTNLRILAFHEPPEYQPPDRWYAKLLNLPVEKLSFDNDVQAVSGATLSSRAALNGARKLLAIYQVMLKKTQ